MVIRGSAICSLASVGLSLLLAASGARAAEQRALSLPSENVSAEAKAKGYIGAQTCAVCHAEKYDHYRSSGHPKKLRPAAEARAWGVPLPVWVVTGPAT